MGAWNFVKGRLYERFDDTHEIHRVSRAESGSPASGSHAVHAQEQAQLLAAALVPVALLAHARSRAIPGALCPRNRPRSRQQPATKAAAMSQLAAIVARCRRLMIASTALLASAW